MRFRIEVTCQPASGWLQYVPQICFQAWVARQLRLKLQMLLHTVRLQPPDSLEYAWNEYNTLCFYGNTQDYLKEGEKNLRLDLCVDIDKRLQSVGYKFFHWPNDLLRFVRQVDFILPNGQRFTYPQDAEKGEMFNY